MQGPGSNAKEIVQPEERRLAADGELRPWRVFERVYGDGHDELRKVSAKFRWEEAKNRTIELRFHLITFERRLLKPPNWGVARMTRDSDFGCDTWGVPSDEVRRSSSDLGRTTYYDRAMAQDGVKSFGRELEWALPERLSRHTASIDGTDAKCIHHFDGPLE